MLQGVFIAKKKDNTIYYRSSITYKSKHISLGSYETEALAHKAYCEANTVLTDTNIDIDNHTSSCSLSFEKWVCLINFRDNDMYSRAPIYLKDKYFYYYFSKNEFYIFDVDDLFYYSRHKLQKRGGHLFVSDYGMQVTILSRYGIKNYAVKGKDYIFKNGIENDYRYSNILVINKYHGVTKSTNDGRDVYTAKIHINGDIIIGRYHTDYEAAIAYNKAADILHSKGITKNFPVNYIIDFDAIKYSSIYNKLRISKAIVNFPKVKD